MVDSCQTVNQANNYAPIAGPEDCAAMVKAVIGVENINQIKFSECVFSPDRDCSQAKASKTASSSPTNVAPPKKKFEVRKPIINIIIPDLTFSDINPEPDARGIIQIPWIGEYIAAVYRLAVTVASILSVILLIREGALIILSGGGEEKVQGYRNIARILTGLVLAWSSYVILYNINASLVSFRPLEIKAVPEDATFGTEYAELSQSEGQAYNQDVKPYLTPSPGVTTAAESVENPWWSSSRASTQFKCSEYEAQPSKFPPSGVVSPDYLSTYDCDGKIKGLNGRVKTVTTIKAMQEPLCAAINAALNDPAGYEIRISSSWRSFVSQVNGWCPTWDDTSAQNKSARTSHAVPGWSNHGKGTAVDAVLYKNGKQVTSFGIKAQCGDDTAEIEKIANFFYNASPNFYRLKIENWHFEFRGTSGANTDRTTGVASGC